MRRIEIVIFMALLVFGCTINPQDSVRVSDGNGTGGGAATTGGAAGSAQNGTQAKLFTLEEVAKHNTKADCWMVIGTMVLDLSGYRGHPGGDTYVPYCGTDATRGFATTGSAGFDHSEMAYGQLPAYSIGELGKPMPAQIVSN